MPIDYSSYPADWKLRSRFVRFYRARNKCEWCGAENGKSHPVTGSRVVLTVAHIYDMNYMSASLLNLAALCQRCHLNHDRAHHMEKARRTRRSRKAIGDLFETAGGGR